MATTQARATHWVERADQLKCLASPVRMDIVDHLSGRPPASIKELADDIGRQASSIYHHVQLLVDVGLVVEAGTRVVNRKSEKLYATAAPRMRLKKALGDSRNAPVMREVVAALCREAERDFSRGLTQKGETQGPHRTLGFYRQVNRVSKSSLKRINALLDEIAEILWQDPDPKGERIALTWMMSPLERDD
jgi:predicted transcriptional regulator